jgi:phospholipid/cholesterol/gamma-HCH transport system substrate-binding protein
VKISNETKVGAIAIVAIVFLILGFNFLKGKRLWSNSTVLYAKYGNVQGLQKSNPVIINGMQVGTIYDIRTDKNMRSILIEMNITKDVFIPENSICVIKSNPLTTASLQINLGDAATHLKNKDTVLTEASGGLLDNVFKSVDPVLADVRKTVRSLDSVLLNFNTIIDPSAKNNIGATLGNLNAITASMIQSAASLQTLLNSETGALAKTLNNTSSITGNLAATNEKVTNVMTNLDKTTTKLAGLEFDKTITTLNSTLADLQAIVSKIGSTDGTLGKMMNDPVLYNNFASTANKLNILLDDIRVNPKRYVNISVFGGKQKGSALTIPRPDTLNAPYYIEKVKTN